MVDEASKTKEVAESQQQTARLPGLPRLLLVENVCQDVVSSVTCQSVPLASGWVSQK